MFSYFFSFQLNSQSDYVLFESDKEGKVKIIDNGIEANSKYCQLIEGTDTLTLYPKDIKFYIINGNDEYVSKSFLESGSLESLFLLKIFDGPYSLYYRLKGGEEIYYLEDNTQKIVPFKKDNFRQKLTELTENCIAQSPNIDLIKFKKEWLSKFIKNYGECNNRLLQTVKYGVHIGIVRTNLVVKKSEVNPALLRSEFIPDYKPTFGLFLELPINPTNMSIHLGISHLQNKFRSKVSYAQIDNFVIIDLASLRFPLQFKYLLSQKPISTYLSGGITYIYNYRNLSSIFQSEIDASSIEFNEPIENIVSDNQLLTSFGVGIQLRKNVNHYYSFELRNNFDMQGNLINSLKRQSIELVCAYNF